MEFCEDLLDCGINFDNYDSVDPDPTFSTVPITPGPDDIVSTHGSVSFDQQHSVGVADGILTTGVDGTTQPISGAARIMTPMCDPRALMGEAVLDSNDTLQTGQYNFKVTVSKSGGVHSRGIQFKFVEKTNTLYVKPKKCVPFCFTVGAPVPAGCWVRAMVIYASEVVAKQRGPVKRCANHISEDMQSGQLTNVEHFMQCRTEDAFYFMMSDHYCVSVPFDKLVEGVCLFSFACYNSCLEYKDDSCRKGKLVKPGLQVLFTLLDANGYALGEDSMDLRTCACPTRDAPVCRSSSSSSKNHQLSNVASSSNNSYLRSSNMTRQQLKGLGVKKHRAHRIRKKRMPQLKHQQQQSLEHVVQQVQQIQCLDKDDVVDEKTSLYKFTCVVHSKEHYKLLCTLRAAFQ